MLKPKQKNLVYAAAVIGTLILIIIILAIINRLPAELVVTSNPDQAHIFINQKDYTTPATIKIKPGNYNIWGETDGYDIFMEQITIKSRQKNRLFIQFVKTTESIPVEGAPLTDIVEPKIKNLPFQNDHFKVEWNSQTLSYLIIPEVPFTNQDTPQNQIKNSWDLYEKYGREALTWIKGQGVTPTSTNIEWWAEEWWPENTHIPL